MKIHRVFGIALVTGTDAEMDKLEQVAEGTHHVHRNQKGGPRKRKVEVYGASIATAHLEEVEKRNREAAESLENPKQTHLDEAQDFGEKLASIARTGPAFKRDCQRWKECMDENPMQRLAGCGSGEDVCDGYLAPIAADPGEQADTIADIGGG